MSLIMGMNSGSSFDGIDVVLAETEIAEDGFPRPPQFLAGKSFPWPKQVEKIILDAFDNKVDMKDLTRLTYIAGAVFAESANQFMGDHNIDPKNIEVLGVDGQTIYQEPPAHDKISQLTATQKNDYVSRWLNGPYPAGYQIGDTSVIAGLTNITTVTNFRQGDHVWGGSAAPLMQYLDFILFRDRKNPTLTLNIGGIANAHLAHKDRRKMVACDTGPGNILSDNGAKHLLNQPWDTDGAVAAKGTVDDKMMADLKNHPYFQRAIPRSLWPRNDFSMKYCEELFARHPTTTTEDIMATLCAFTAEAVAISLSDNVPKEALDEVDYMYASGGGMKNKQIIRYIQEKLPSNITLLPSSEIGIPPEFKEALKFSTLAFSTINKIANNIPAASHASQYTILGKVSYAPWKAQGVQPM